MSRPVEEEVLIHLPCGHAIPKNGRVSRRRCPACAAGRLPVALNRGRIKPQRKGPKRQS